MGPRDLPAEPANARAPTRRAGGPPNVWTLYTPKRLNRQIPQPQTPKPPEMCQNPEHLSSNRPLSTCPGPKAQWENFLLGVNLNVSVLPLALKIPPFPESPQFLPRLVFGKYPENSFLRTRSGEPVSLNGLKAVKPPEEPPKEGRTFAVGKVRILPRERAALGSPALELPKGQRTPRFVWTFLVSMLG